MKRLYSLLKIDLSCGVRDIEDMIIRCNEEIKVLKLTKEKLQKGYDHKKSRYDFFYKASAKSGSACKNNQCKHHNAKPSPAYVHFILLN